MSLCLLQAGKVTQDHIDVKQIIYNMSNSYCLTYYITVITGVSLEGNVDEVEGRDALLLLLAGDRGGEDRGHLACQLLVLGPRRFFQTQRLNVLRLLNGC